MKNLTKESYPRCATVVEGVVYVFSDYLGHIFKNWIFERRWGCSVGTVQKETSGYNITQVSGIWHFK